MMVRCGVSFPALLQTLRAHVGYVAKGLRFIRQHLECCYSRGVAATAIAATMMMIVNRSYLFVKNE